jgi:hypothetical protein
MYKPKIRGGVARRISALKGGAGVGVERRISDLTAGGVKAGVERRVSELKGGPKPRRPGLGRAVKNPRRAPGAVTPKPAAPPLILNRGSKNPRRAPAHKGGPNPRRPGPGRSVKNPRRATKV